MSNNIRSFKNIDPTNLEFSEMKTNAKGGGTVYVNPKIIIQTPKAKIPFGMSRFESEDGSFKHSLNVSLGSTTQNGQEFKEWFTSLDNSITKGIVKNSEKWLGKKKSEAVVQELYKSMVIESKDGKYEPTYKVKFMTNKNGEFQAPVYLDKNEKGSIDDLTKGSSVSLIMQLTGIWFVGKQCGCTWTVLQVKSYPGENFTAYAFKDEDDGEDGEEGEEEEYEDDVSE